MSEQRRRFSPQFKAEAVQMVIETGKPITEVPSHHHRPPAPASPAGPKLARDLADIYVARG